jgi:hypothetical protein
VCEGPVPLSRRQILGRPLQPPANYQQQYQALANVRGSASRGGTPLLLGSFHGRVRLSGGCCKNNLPRVGCGSGLPNVVGVMELEWWWEWSGAPSRVLHKGNEVWWVRYHDGMTPEAMPCVDKARDPHPSARRHFTSFCGTLTSQIPCSEAILTRWEGHEHAEPTTRK